MPVFAQFRQARCGFCTGVYASSSEGYSHNKPALHFRHAVQNIQAVLRRETTKQSEYKYRMVWGYFSVKHVVLQIFFHGTNREALLEKIPAECLPRSLGGSLDIPDYPGSLLADMLSYYEKEFEREFI